MAKTREASTWQAADWHALHYVTSRNAVSEYYIFYIWTINDQFEGNEVVILH